MPPNQLVSQSISGPTGHKSHSGQQGNPHHPYSRSESLTAPLPRVCLAIDKAPRLSLAVFHLSYSSVSQSSVEVALMVVVLLLLSACSSRALWAVAGR